MCSKRTSLRADAGLIALSQVKHPLGVPLPQTDHLQEVLGEMVRAVPQSHRPTLAISAGNLLLLLASCDVAKLTGLAPAIPPAAPPSNQHRA